MSRLRQLLGRYTPDWRERMVVQPDVQPDVIQAPRRPLSPAYYERLLDQEPWARAGVMPIMPPQLQGPPRIDEIPAGTIAADATRVAPQQPPPEIEMRAAGGPSVPFEPLPPRPGSRGGYSGATGWDDTRDFLGVVGRRVRENTERAVAAANRAAVPLARGAAAMVPGGMTPSEGFDAGREQADRLMHNALGRADMSEYMGSGIHMGGHAGQVKAGTDIAMFLAATELGGAATSAAARMALPSIAARAAKQAYQPSALGYGGALDPRRVSPMTRAAGRAAMMVGRPGAQPTVARTVAGVTGRYLPTDVALASNKDFPNMAHILTAMNQDKIAAGGFDPSEHFASRLAANVLTTAGTQALIGAVGALGGRKGGTALVQGDPIAQARGQRPAGGAVTAETLEGVAQRVETPSLRGVEDRLRLQGPVVGQDPRFDEFANKAALRLRDEGIREFPVGGARTVYHGVAPRHAEDIALSGEIRSHLLGGQKTRGGTVDEVGLIWVSTTEEMAEGWSIREIGPGATERATVVGMKVPDDLRLMDQHDPLTADQAARLMEMSPRTHEPIVEGDNLRQAFRHFAAIDATFKDAPVQRDILKALELDGYTTDRGANIALAVDRIPVDPEAAGVAEELARPPLITPPPEAPAPQRIPGEVDTGMRGKWVSKLQATLEGGPGKATGSEWDRYLNPAKRGFSESEAEWTGIRGYLADNADTKLSKDEVLGFAREHEIRLKEVIKGAAHADVSGREGGDKVRQALRDWPATWQLQVKAEETLAAYERGDINAFVARGELQDAGAPGDIADYLTGDVRSSPKFAGQTQGQFGLDPESNYEEILVQLDRPAARVPRERATQDPPGYKVRTSHVVPGDPGYSYFEGVGLTSRSYDTPAEARTAAWDEYDSDRSYGMPEPGAFTGGHWDEPDVMGHIRKTDREVTAVGGRAAKGKSFHVEEFQGDWPQKGRKEGYHSGPAKAVKNKKLSEERRGRGWSDNVYDVYDSDGRHLQDVVADSEESALSGATASRSYAVPDMPYKKTSEWVGLLVRRALQQAVRGGYDRISWTSGEQAAELYDLRQHVSRIDYDDGTLRAFDHDGYERMLELNVTPEQLPKYIGKDPAKRLMSAEGAETRTSQEREELLSILRLARSNAADRYITEIERSIREGTSGPHGQFLETDIMLPADIRSDPDAFIEGLGDYGYGVPSQERLRALERELPSAGARSIEGEDLAVGGGGMIEFYDRIVPNAVMKELKKYGAVLEEVDVIPSDKGPRIVEYEGIDLDADVEFAGPEPMFKWVDVEGRDIPESVDPRGFLTRAEAEEWGRGQPAEGDPQFP